MTNETTPVAVTAASEVIPVAVEATPAKKTTPKKVAKKAAKKAPAKAAKKSEVKGKKTPAKKATKAAPAAKAEKNGKATPKIEGLREPQVRILQALSKSSEPLTRKELAEKASVDSTKIGVYVGPRTNESEKTSTTWPFQGLYELGMVKVEDHENQPLVNSITKKGLKVLASAK